MPTGPARAFRLGQLSPTLSLTSAGQVEEIAREVFRQAKRRVDVRAVRLDLKFFNSPELTRTITSLLTSNLRNRIRFLVDDDFHFKNSQPRLMHLARTYSTYIKIHKVTEEQKGENEFFIVADGVCYMRETAGNKYPVRAAAYAPGQCKLLQHKFTDYWDNSVQITELFTTGLD